MLHQDQFQQNYFNITDVFRPYLDMNSLFFSPDLISKITHEDTGYPQNNYIETISYQYNDDGYPISSETTRNGGVYSTAIFEYY